MDLVLTLLLILFSLGVLAFCLYLVSKGKYLSFEAREERRYSGWGIVLGLISWMGLLVVLSTYIDISSSNWAIIVVLFIAISLAIEVAQKRSRKRNQKSLEDAE